MQWVNEKNNMLLLGIVTCIVKNVSRGKNNNNFTLSLTLVPKIEKGKLDFPSDLTYGYPLFCEDCPYWNLKVFVGEAGSDQEGKIQQPDTDELKKIPVVELEKEDVD